MMKRKGLLMAAKVEDIVKIKRRYPKEWLLLTNVVADALTHPVKGKLVMHSKNRDEIYDRLPRLRAKSVCIEYTGEIPKDLFYEFVV
jgi:hypothetical protein